MKRRPSQTSISRSLDTLRCQNDLRTRVKEYRPLVEKRGLRLNHYDYIHARSRDVGVLRQGLGPSPDH